MKLPKIKCTECGKMDHYDISWLCQNCKKIWMKQVNNESKQKREADDRMSFGRKRPIANPKRKTRHISKKPRKRR